MPRPGARYISRAHSFGLAQKTAPSRSPVGTKNPMSAIGFLNSQITKIWPIWETIMKLWPNPKKFLGVPNRAVQERKGLVLRPHALPPRKPHYIGVIARWRLWNAWIWTTQGRTLRGAGMPTVGEIISAFKPASHLVLGAGMRQFCAMGFSLPAQGCS